MKFSIPGFFACALMILPGALWSVPAGPVDTGWYLMMLGDAPAPVLQGGRQVQFSLDSARTKATGFAGCNRFFGNYELSGATLVFGPLAATRMACPDEESALESRFLDTLARTQGWRMDGDDLLLLANGKVLARFARAPGGTLVPGLESLVFHSKVLESGPVILEHGEYRAPAAPGSAAEIEVRLTDKQASGMLNGAQITAMVITTSLGGSGTFRELALLSRVEDDWVNTDTVLLGDRVRVNSVAIDAGMIVLSMTTHASGDPQCCPTREVQQRFTVRDQRLVPVP